MEDVVDHQPPEDRKRHSGNKLIAVFAMAVVQAGDLPHAKFLHFGAAFLDALQ